MELQNKSENSRQGCALAFICFIVFVGVNAIVTKSSLLEAIAYTAAPFSPYVIGAPIYLVYTKIVYKEARLLSSNTLLWICIILEVMSVFGNITK